MPQSATQPAIWNLAHGRSLSLDRPRLLAIINLTPDSFHSGARFTDAHAAADHGERAVAEGADMLDVGAESTRPGAARIPADEQLRRLLPFLTELRARAGAASVIPVSVDTTRSEVARAALDLGADAINDVSACTEDAALLPLVARHGAGLILMHRLRPPGTDVYSDQYAAPPAYPDVVEDVREFLAGRTRVALDAGVARESIVIDPGLGFGKSVEQNLELIRATPRFAALGCPVLSALSRKSFVGRVSLGRDSTPEERLEGTLTLSIAHLRVGARLFRVHDIAAHTTALRAAWSALGKSADSSVSPAP